MYEKHTFTNNLYKLNVVLQVRGSCKDDLHAVQVPERVTSLASNQAYVLETPGTTYLWIGKVKPLILNIASRLLILIVKTYFF